MDDFLYNLRTGNLRRGDKDHRQGRSSQYKGPQRRNGGDRRAAVTDWPGRLRDMYRAWGKNRRMRVQGLQDAPAPGGRSRRLILAVSGYAAFDTLQAETGLHVWEEPDPRGSRRR